VQEGFVGLMMAYKKYNPNRGVSLGAFASRYIFGRIYRSLVGTKNLIHNKKILLMELSDKIIDKKNDHEFLTELQDHLNSKFTPDQIEILRMFFDNYKKNEILRKFKITSDEFDRLTQEFYESFM